MKIDARRTLMGLAIAGMAGAVLFLPAIVALGTFLSPSTLAPATAHVAPLLGDAIWARTLGGRAAELRPVEPFSIARMISCHALAERGDDRAARDVQHEECMKLIPAIQGAAFLSIAQMRADGVWQTPRVPFIQIAMVTKMTNTWTRAQLLDSLAERGEFGIGLHGAEQTARALFNRAPADLTLPQAALVAALLGNFRVDPWCAPERLSQLRRQVLERMRDNLVIDEGALQAANLAELGLSAPPPSHKPCND
jgi:hypothetical protein